MYAEQNTCFCMCCAKQWNRTREKCITDPTKASTECSARDEQGEAAVIARRQHNKHPGWSVFFVEVPVLVEKKCELSSTGSRNTFTHTVFVSLAFLVGFYSSLYCWVYTLRLLTTLVQVFFKICLKSLNKQLAMMD